jgi:hypothetical protein
MAESAALITAVERLLIPKQSLSLNADAGAASVTTHVQTIRQKPEKCQ